MENKPKYISLREAAQISGLHSDYIGQLIRKGKIKGVKVYSKIAWMTSLESVNEYLQSQNKEQNVKKITYLERFIAKLKSLAQLPVIIQIIFYASMVVSIGFILILFYIASVSIEKRIEAKTIKKIEAGLFLLIFLILGWPKFLLAAGVPRILNHQGRLFDVSGNLLGEGGNEFCFKFSIYDDATVGAPDNKLWPTSTPSVMTVLVTDGVFNVGIGDVAAGGDVLDFNFESSDTAYLNIEVASRVGSTCASGDGAEVFDNLNPRHRIVSAGYALNAATIRGYTASENASSTAIPVLSGGNLILGVANPQINATGTNPLFLQGGNISGNLLLNVFSGFVGIGTSTPRAKLHLASGSFLQDGPTPTVVGGTNLNLPGGGVMDLKIAGKYAYAIFNNSAGNDILRIIDITDPANPAVVGGSALSLPGFPRSIFLNGQYAYITFRNTAGANNFRIIDVTNPAIPTVIGGDELSLPNNGQHIFVSGHYAYLTFDNAAGTNTFRVIDIGNPKKIVEVGGNALNLPENPRQIYVQGRYAYIVFYASTPTNALRVIDLANPTNPIIAGGGSLSLGSSAWSIAVSGRYAYIGFDNAAGNSVFRIVDISNPNLPATTGGNNLSLPGFAKSLVASGKYVYLALDNSVGSNGLRIIDVGNPTSPFIAGGEDLVLPGFPKTIQISGKNAYLGFFQGAGNDAFRIVDTTGIEAAAILASTIEAGSLQITTNAQIQNQLAVAGGVAVSGGLLSSGDLAVKGQASFAPSANATTTFSLSDADDEEKLFSVDTANNRIKIGDDDGAGEPTTIFVFDTKADAGDPNGSNGAMYYNLSTQRFRCFENNLWKNCHQGLWHYTLLSDALGVAFLNASASGVEVNNLISRRFLDLSGVRQIRAQFAHSLNSALVKLRIDFSLDNCATWEPTPLIGAFGAAVGANNVQTSSFGAIPSTAQTEICVRAIIVGNGSLDPVVRHISLDVN